MLSCPNKNLQEWKDLVNKEGEDKAYFIWNSSKGNPATYVAMTKPQPQKVSGTELSKFKKAVGLTKSQVQSDNEGKIRKKIKNYNTKNNSNYKVKFKQVGQSNLVTFTIEGSKPNEIQGKLFNKADEESGATDTSYVTPILESLKKRFKLDYEIINDPNKKIRGEYDGDKVVINLAHVTKDTLFHEYAHPFIRIMKNTNKVAYNRLQRQIIQAEEGSNEQKILSKVRRNYADLSDEAQIEEAIVSAIGMYADGTLKGESIISAVVNFLKSLMKKLGISKVDPKTIAAMSLQELGALMSSDLDVNIEGAKDHFNIGEKVHSKTDKQKDESKIENAYERQYVFIKRSLSRMYSQLKDLEFGSDKHTKFKKKISDLEDALDKASEDQSHEGFMEMGKWSLDRASSYVDMLEQDKASVTKQQLIYISDTVEAFRNFKDLETEASKLHRRLYPFLSSHSLDIINSNATEGEPITQEGIDKQDKDIGPFKRSVGALSDLASYIGRTVGSLIKHAQNNASITNKKLRDEVQEEVNKLKDWAKENGYTLEEAYGMLINEYESEIKLINTYYSGKQSEKWEFMMKEGNEPLRDFHKFYKSVLTEAERNLPYKIDKNGIPNIAKDDIVYKLKNMVNVNTSMNDMFQSTEGLIADIVPTMYRGRMGKDLKSRDLGASLLQFGAYANNHHYLTEALPEVRILQKQLEFKQLSNGEVVDRKLVSYTDQSLKVLARDSNLYDMINKVIDMQLKGKMSKDTFKKWKVKEIKDLDGNIIGYKEVDPDQVVDLALKYNSLLRIGLSPITAAANVLFGEVSNLIEAVGGRFFTVKGMAQATKIFFSQVDYTSNKKDSPLHNWLEKLNPLQELDDYNIGDDIKLKSMSSERLYEFMYSMQKKGELYLQSRTMLAILIKDGYMNPDGTNTEKGEDISEKEASIVSDKIQRANQMIHGRYSQREAATAQQSIYYRAAIQFRKWIPSALETRFMEKQYDNRLQKEIEGRYVTFYNLVRDLGDTVTRLKSGDLTELEVYNMKKTFMEISIFAATVTMYAALRGGDDDEGRRRRKNPAVKIMLTLLDRIAGDIEFFYHPDNAANLLRNAVPLAKTAQDLGRAIKYLPYVFGGDDSILTRGPLKGDNKFWAASSKVMIGFKPAQDVWKLINDNPLSEFK